MNQKLMNCPFCGHEAHLNQSYNTRGVIIVCSNLHCIPKPGVFIPADVVTNEDGITAHLEFENAVSRAILHWNNRAEERNQRIEHE